MKKNIFIVLLLVTANMLCAEDTAYFGYPDYGFPQSQRAMWYNNMPYVANIRIYGIAGMMYPAGNIDTLYGFAFVHEPTDTPEPDFENFIFYIGSVDSVQYPYSEGYVAIDSVVGANRDMYHKRPFKATLNRQCIPPYDFLTPPTELYRYAYEFRFATPKPIDGKFLIITVARLYDNPSESSCLLYQEWLEDDAYVNMAENIRLCSLQYGGSGEINVSCEYGRDNGYGDTVRSYIALFPILTGAADTADTTGHQQGGDTVGVASAAEPQVRLNTDPAGGWVEIGVAGGTVFDAAVYDVCGKVAARPCTASGSVRIDTSRWPAGVYVARVRTAAGVMSCKFVVARR